MELEKKLSDLIGYIETEIEKNKNEFKEMSGQDISNYIFMEEDAFKKELPADAQILILKNEILDHLKTSAQSIIYIYKPTDFADQEYGIDLLDQGLKLALAYSYMLNLLMRDRYNDFVNDIKKRVTLVLSEEINNLKQFCSNVRNQENKNIMSMYKSSYAEKMYGLLSALNNPIETINKRRYNLANYKDIIGSKGISKNIVDNLFIRIGKIQTPKKEKYFGDKTPEK